MSDRDEVRTLDRLMGRLEMLRCNMLNGGPGQIVLPNREIIQRAIHADNVERLYERIVATVK